MDKIVKENLNDFHVRFVLDKEFADDNGGIGLSTKFAIQNEEDNVLYFYYHILDICKGIIEGSINMYQLPQIKNFDFETHEYSYHSKELLKEYMNHILKQIEEYRSYKKSLNI